MDYLSQLIPECLDLIFTHLLLDNRKVDVASLLQVNKSLAAVALRHLYTDPFQHAFHAPAEEVYYAYEAEEDEEEGEKRGPLETVDALARMLLARCLPASVPEIVAVVFPELSAPQIISAQDSATATLSTPGSSSSSSPLDYLGHIRHLNLCTPIAYTWQHEVLHKAAPATLEYIQQKEFQHHCGAKDVLIICRRRLNLMDDPLPLYHQFFRVMVLREVNWMLVNSVATVGDDGSGSAGSGGEIEDEEKVLGQQLKSLAIPVSDVGRYVEAVGKFENLEHVQFCLDEVMQYTEDDVFFAMEEEAEANEEIGEWLNGVSTLLKKNTIRRDKAMQNLLMFVQEHGRLFPGQLKTATCPDSEIWDPWTWTPLPQKCSEEIQFQIMQLLPPLKKPSVLDERNWMQFLAHPTETYLGAVKKIDMNLESGISETYERVVENRGFLQRCRGLKTLTLGSLGAGAYKWAVEEKKALLENNSDGNNSNNKRQERSLLQKEENDDRHLHLRYGLVPLEQAFISGLGDVPFKDMDEIDDIAYAFSETLTELGLNMPYTLDESFINNRHDPKPMWTIRIGRGWVDLPNLRDLYIVASVARLVLDPELLVHCPNLVNVDLYDDVTYDYHPRLAIRDGCLPAQLEKCKSMTLEGWSALTFHPGTLSSMRERLTELSIQTTCGSDDLCFILPPSPEAPVVHLWDDVLAGEEPVDSDDGDGDFLDQRQEQGRHGPGWYRWTWDWQLPLLTKLELNSKFAYEFQFQMLAGCPLLKSLHLNIHTTMAHTRDLDWSVLNVPGKKVVLPALQKLTMLGGWNVLGGDVFLEEFLSTLSPNLEVLVAKHWIGVTLSGFLSILRKKAPLSEEGESTFLTSWLSDEHQEQKEYNKIWKMDLAGKEMHGEDENQLNAYSELGLVYKGMDEYDDVVEGEVLEGVEFSFKYSKFHVLKSPQTQSSS
ncbi:hypothetical protein BG015_009632 [Linnemannia schmuckeri]|uniref:Uncharacterized protein n=1 Tax=Linnemannia schmuckeri TaxID=64567 RepID=A0A9P5V9T4_9FUNG|nr:hypothetical protein BG015_009632 [Linnemannia schmuckeri]